MEASMFIPIQKVDLERREVWGWAAVEEPDNSDEVMDYVSSKPHWMEWSQRAQKRSGGKSLGNLRAMHQNVAAGKLIDLRADDMRRGFYIGAKIVDDNEWNKVTQGVYTGFSVGGSYLKRWMDYRDQGKTRYTAKPTEVSIVDAPCIPSATFEIVKGDGLVEIRHFSPTDGENVLKWDESKHPRDHGKFSSKPGGSGDSEEDDWADDDETLPEGVDQYADAKQQLDDKLKFARQNRYESIRQHHISESDDEPYARTAYDEKQGHTGRLQPVNTNSGKGYFGMTDDAKRQATVRPDEKQPGAWYTHAMADGEKTVITHHSNEFEARRRAELHLSNKPLSDVQKVSKMEGGETLAEKFEMFKMLANEILEEIDELEKVDIPGAPEEIASIQLPGEVGGDYEVEHMPEPSTTMTLDENVSTGQEQLAQHAVKSQDLSAAFEAWLPKVGAMVKAEIAAALELKEGKSPSPAVRMVKVARSPIKVSRKEKR